MKMRKSILLLCGMALISATVFGGTPDQDPGVEQLRGKLNRGKTPQEANLRLGDKWKCMWFAAMPDDFVTGYEVISFARFDGFVTITTWEIDGNSRKPDGAQTFGTLAYTSSGLVGHGGGSYHNQVYLIRLSQGGDLIIESSMPKDVTDRYKLVASVYSPDRGAWAYAICPKDQILSNQ
ncbi:MAG: hypothetical protein NDJ90_08055 [Oligoflexia bacterium]|nr:hypothetical protein [Oligoflexia bacterium]